MHIHADMRGVGTLLLALDGVPVGLVVEADTQEGWLRRYDTRGLEVHTLPEGASAKPSAPPSSLASYASAAANDAHAEYRRRVAECPVVRVEGKVDFIGDTATDPDWMIAQRLVAVRIRHGLPIDESLAHDTSGMVASVLERLASQLRSGSMAATNLSMSCSAEPFPLPDDKVRYVKTGSMCMNVAYVSTGGVEAYETAKTEWARENPDLVAGHVRSLLEGESKIVEEAQAVATHRMAAARFRRTLL
jgi:hypothetical protein